MFIGGIKNIGEACFITELEVDPRDPESNIEAAKFFFFFPQSEKVSSWEKKKKSLYARVAIFSKLKKNQQWDGSASLAQCSSSESGASFLRWIIRTEVKEYKTLQNKLARACIVETYRAGSLTNVTRDQRRRSRLCKGERHNTATIQGLGYVRVSICARI